jgi:hypothetical protein
MTTIPLIRINTDNNKLVDLTIDTKKLIILYNRIKKEYAPMATPFIILKDSETLEYITGFDSSQTSWFSEETPENIAGGLEEFINGNEAKFDDVIVPATAIIDISNNNKILNKAYEILKPKYGLKEMNFKI